jgi:SAM-dependent methyltransferase
MPIRFSSKSARRKAREPWQQVSLVAGYLAGRHFVGTSDLHYGLWVDGIEPQIRNLPCAQEAYSEFVLRHIPRDAGHILDVGSGAGSIACKLVARGHRVDCVSPSVFLNQQARDRLGDRARIFECAYEDFQTAEMYDAIVFCESFQYVNICRALEQITSQLRRGGHLVICDFFRLPANGKSPISGGHNITAFNEAITRFPLQLVEDIDITPQTAPTFTVIDQAFTNVLKPIWDESDAAFAKNHPLWSKFFTWLFRHRLAKVRKKYFSHERSAENFQKFKTYRLMRFERH